MLGSGAGRETRNSGAVHQQVTSSPPFRGSHYIFPSVWWNEWHSSERLSKVLRQREVTQIWSLKGEQEMDKAQET